MPSSLQSRDQGEPRDGRGGQANGNPIGVSLSPVTAPALSLPKGGGAIRGIDEKFAANRITGTGSTAVPIPISPGRSGFGPQLTLVYDSGAGNGPFGFGWSPGLPAVTRKTDQGLPQYRDADGSDTFILSGAEDLVPVRDLDGESVSDSTSVPGFRIARFRPRIEGGFARIECWTRIVDGDVHWRAMSPDNVLSVYGRDETSRIADPADPAKVFSWLLCETRDDRGNAIIYDYKPEDAAGVDLSASHEWGRGDASSAARTANRYLKRIRYGNRAPLLDNAGQRPVDLAPGEVEGAAWMFEVVLDYGEHDASDPRPGDAAAWACRNDPFSSYRPTFEVRTYRLCQRILMFHHFPDEPGVGADCLIRSTRLTYRDLRGIPEDRQRGHPLGSFVASITQTGYIRSAGGGYVVQSLPPVEFEYSQAKISGEVRELDTASLEDLPAGVDGQVYRWVDLDGEGLTGVLAEQGEAWYYKPNLGDGRFGPAYPVAPRPSLASFRGSRQQLLDLAGDGELDLVQFDRPPAGFYERDGGTWSNFVPFTSLPNVDWGADNLRLIDLTGDGRADLLLTENDVFTWYSSLAEAGFAPAERTAQAPDDERGARLVFADGTETIFLADMSGDGLTDLVRIRNGEICYWPNRGYARFGSKLTMSAAPLFDCPERFDPRRVRLADIDGSGVADILYLGDGEITVWLNEAGNGWSPAQRLPDLPHVDTLCDVQIVDLLGSGTACLVWSSRLPANAVDPVRYIDLMGRTKPNLLVRIVNNLGAETRIHYASSTRFYLADRRAGRPWITRLPFPVQVVEKVEAIDHVSRTRFASQFSYHHGFYDGVEREFRGFGMVEQQDSEAFEDYVVGVAHIEGTQTLAPELFQPSVTTRAWFHTGAYRKGDLRVHPWAGEYFSGEQILPDPVLPSGMNDQEARECLRALKGAALREEVYSFDGSPRAQHPYSVVEHSYEVRRLQRPSASYPAVFHTIGTESITCHYERNPADPRISHSFNLEVGPYGNVLQSAEVLYGRQLLDPDLPGEVTGEQQQLHISYGEIDFTPDIDRLAPPPAYRLRNPFEARSYEITGVAPTNARFTLAELKGKIAAAYPLEYEETASGNSAQRRRLAQTRALFRDNAMMPLPLGEWDSLGLGFESYRLAFKPDVVATYYAGEITDAQFAAAGFVHFDADSNWWIPSGVATYPADPAAHFYLPTGTRDALGTETLVTFDRYDLLAERVRVIQAAWSESQAVNDYRVLGPILLTDPNQNRSGVEFDALGMVVKSAAMGKAGAGEGDSLADPTTRLEYDVFNWMNNRQPVFAHVFAREQHGPANPRWQESYIYSTGGGSVALVKARVHPGKALQPNDDGTVTEVDADPRWVGNGRTILNNKGAPIKQYEPYFSATHEYEDERALREIGATPILYYDAAGRNVRTEFPNGTLTRVEFDPWMERAWDSNDTVLESRWYNDRGSPDPSTDPEPVNDPEKRAAWLTAQHANTPGVAHFDSLGRPIYAVSDFGNGRTSAVRTELDLTGRFSKLFDQAGRLVSSGFVGEAGTPIFGESAERGRSWTFLNVLGGLVKRWDEHGRAFRAEYDALHRPTATFVHLSGQPEKLFNYVVYGDRHPQAVELNLLGSSHQVFDPSGMVRVEALDFKGNPISVERVLCKDYQNIPDWRALSTQPDYAAIQTAAALALEMDEVFAASSIYDALNRPTRVTLPDGTVIAPAYNEAGFVASLGVKIGGQGGFVDFLKDQDYDAKGQRQFAHYGNDVLTSYFYDPQTFRLTNLLTVRSGDPRAASLQDLHFTLDPVGNFTQVRDDAQQTHYFANAVVEPQSLFAYDALYQLIRAVGREHAGLGAGQPGDQDTPANPLPHPNNAAAVRTYTEQYAYDDLGNILSLQRIANGGSWTRHYRYSYQDSPADGTNRLVSTSAPGDPDAGPYTTTYDHDAFGNMTHLRSPNPDEMRWDFLDQLQRVDLGGGGTAYYVYRLGGGRLRKVIERAGGARVERIYLGVLEIYRERQGNAAPHFERRTLHISDDAGRIAQVDVKTIDSNGQEPANAIGSPVIRYQFGNQLGSAVLETDDAGMPISYEEYHPYGTTAYRSSRPGADLSLKRYRFSGKERDDETGLYYFGARYYAAWLGRWTSADPAGFLAGLNFYRYCSNSPATRTDPYGLDDERCWYNNTSLGAVMEANGAECHVPGMQYVTESGQPITQPAPGAGAGSASSSTPPPAPTTAPPPVRAGITAVQEAARPTAALIPDPVSRTAAGTPRTFTPGEPLTGPYNLWSNPKGGGLTSAGNAPGFIMEDTAFEEAAEATARRLGYAGRYDPTLKYGSPQFNETWHPTSDALATRAGLSQMGVESHGIDSASLARNPGYNPAGSVQVTREIPRVRLAGGAMAGLGLFSGGLVLYGASDIPNPAVRYTAYTTGVAEILGSLRFIQGLWMLGRGPGSAAMMGQGAMLGRVAGGVGAIVLSTYSLINHLQERNYGVTLGDSAGIVGGGAVLAGSGPVAAIAGGVAITNYLGDAVERKVTAATGSRTAGVAAGTASGAVAGGLIGAAVGVWFFGVGAPVGAAVGAIIGGIAGFIGSFW